MNTFCKYHFMSFIYNSPEFCFSLTTFAMAFVSVLQIPNVDSDQADTYKCFAINPFGKAVCTAALNVIEGGKFIKLI